MDFQSFSQAAYDSSFGLWMRESVRAMPFVEAIHVLAVALVFGTILVVDLRLLGFADAKRAFTRVSDEMLKWTWVSFAIAVITGVLMFAANALTYYSNTAFRLKLLAMLAAGLNMLVFQLLTLKGVSRWDQEPRTPTAARLAGFLSITLWLLVIGLGRWIGFSKGYDFSVPEDVQFDFG
jgi:hypothetical protein